MNNKQRFGKAAYSRPEKTNQETHEKAAPPAMNRYGKTWWGQQFIGCFANISEGTRLVRGRTLANSTAVRDFQYSGNFLRAKVQDGLLYTVEVRFLDFSLDDREAILKIITDNTKILNRVRKREIPADLLEACNQKGIQILPKRWDDLRTSCTCKDRVKPCKHLSAILYLGTREVDLNPFVIFELQGLDILETLREAGVVIKEIVEKVPESEIPEDTEVGVNDDGTGTE